jgi:hypothetical protein
MNFALVLLQYFCHEVLSSMPVTVAEWSKECTVFVRSEAGIVG